MKNLNGKVAFVTGGASGIGFGMARNFLSEGMKVVIADYSDAHLATAREALAGSNAVHFIKVDVSDRTALRAATEEALQVFGKIHVLCNNAGVGGGGTAADPEFDEWDKAISINLGGVINGTKIIVPIIQRQGEGGHIVNTSSMAGMVPLPGMAAYSTAKYAVRGFSESLRMQLAPEGIGVSCLFPGATQTNLVGTPLDEEAPPGPDGDFIRKLYAAMRVAMTPMEMGRRVVEAIKDNRFHILTHREFIDEVKARHRAIEEGFPEDDELPEGRAEFERTRRAMVEQLFDMPAKD